MQPKPMSTTAADADGRAGGARARREPLSVIHAQALYTPIPPVEFDDDGYPCRDGRKMESTRHGRWLTYGIDAAKLLLSHLPNALVAYDLGVFFEEGNRRAVVSPDIVVALDCGRQDRGSYKLWEEGRPPDLFLEALSERTWRRDVNVKPGLYQDLGIPEYWILDAIDKLPSPIVGYRLLHGRYRTIRPTGSGAWRSDVLGAELLIDQGEFRIRSLATGEIVPEFTQLARMHAGAEQARTEAEQARAEAERARVAAERRIAELEAELRRRQD